MRWQTFKVEVDVQLSDDGAPMTDQVLEGILQCALDDGGWLGYTAHVAQQPEIKSK